MEGFVCAADEAAWWSSSSSSLFRIIVQPGGKAEWWVLRSLDLKYSPPKTGWTVRVWPLGRWTIDCGIVVEIVLVSCAYYALAVLFW